MHRVMSTQKLPIVAEFLRAMPRTNDGHGDPDGRAHELLHGEHAHLREVRHGRLPAVVLPVRIGRERHHRVETQRGGTRPKC